MRKGCEVLEKCEDMIYKLGMFSANVTMDDISTTNLKYLLVNFLFTFYMFFFLSNFGTLSVLRSFVYSISAR